MKKKILLLVLIMFFVACSNSEQENFESETYYLGTMITTNNVEYGKIRFVYINKDNVINLERFKVNALNAIFIRTKYYFLDSNFHYEENIYSTYNSYIAGKLIIDFKVDEKGIHGTFQDEKTQEKGNFVCVKMPYNESMQ